MRTVGGLRVSTWPSQLRVCWSDLVGVHLILVHMVRVLDDLHQLIPESLRVEFLNARSTRNQSAPPIHGTTPPFRHTHTTTLTCLQSVGDLGQLGYRRLFVHKLLLVQVSEPAAVEAHPEVGSKHPLRPAGTEGVWEDEETRKKQQQTTTTPDPFQDWC